MYTYNKNQRQKVVIHLKTFIFSLSLSPPLSSVKTVVSLKDRAWEPLVKFKITYPFHIEKLMNSINDSL